MEANVTWPDNGICVHTNHYLQPGQNFRDLKPLRDPYLSTYLRWRRAQRSLAELTGGIDVQGIQNVLKDHMDKPYSVCMHRNPAVEPIRQIVTCLSIVLNLNQRQIHYTIGNPCRGEIQVIEVEGQGERM